MKVQGAAISLQGVNFAVVVVSEDLLKSPGEADMAISLLRRPRPGPIHGRHPHRTDAVEGVLGGLSVGRCD